MDDLRSLTEIAVFMNGEISFLTDIVVREKVLTLVVNGTKIASIACLGEKMTELGIGFAFSEGIINKLSDISTILHDKKKNLIEIKTEIKNFCPENYFSNTEKVTGCGGGISRLLTDHQKRGFSKLNLLPECIPVLMNSFQNSSTLFRETGGVHSAGLVLSEELEFYAEDIGRHNAVDKVIGTAILRKRQISDYSLLTSGRISSEIVRKAVRLHIPMIISRSAPTSSAISQAWHYGIYLIGFARNNRFNVYTGLKEITEHQ